MLLKSILAGALYFLSFPPFDYWYLIFPAIYFFYSSIISSEKSFSKGFIFGSISYGVILFGIQFKNFYIECFPLLNRCRDFDT